VAPGFCFFWPAKTVSSAKGEKGFWEMWLSHACQWLSSTSVGTALRESTFVYPVIETVHVLAIILLVGTVAMVDLRLLGVVMKRERASAVVRQILPLTWAGFAVMLLSGSLLFWANAGKYYSNPAFRVKLVLLFLVGLNPLVFHLTTFRSVASWDDTGVTPIGAKLAALFSLTLWSGTIIAGRAIAYFQ
jgi:hypothetical protein